MFELQAETVRALLATRGLSGTVAAAPKNTAGLAWAESATPEARLQVLETIAAHLGLDWAGELPPQLPPTLIAILDPVLGRHYGVVPLAESPTGVDLLVRDPFDPRIVSELAAALGRSVRCVVADPEAVSALICRYYGSEGDRVGNASGENRFSGGRTELDRLPAPDVPAPVAKAVDDLLARAVRDRASDLHLEVFEDEFQVRMRVDGTLGNLVAPPLGDALPMVSRIKVLAGLDIAERRRPQDGRIRLVQSGRTVDLRVSTLPTQHGESVVLRVLDAPESGRTLTDLGLPAGALAGLGRVLARPHGLLVVTGPTGSGKTTTLYAVLERLNTPGRKILTVEDPVEYEIEGITQIPVAGLPGRTFPALLRSFLRHDPDVIMVGEIRDRETARVAVQAALTGHLVLSTLHATDTVGVIARLIDLGIEPYLIAAALQGVLAQRLVPRLCPHCRVPVEIDRALRSALGADDGDGFRSARGCARCEQRGRRGRLGIFEWLSINEGIRDAIASGAPPAAVRVAAGDGVDLRKEGRRLALAGEAAPEDIVRVC